MRIHLHAAAVGVLLAVIGSTPPLPLVIDDTNETADTIFTGAFVTLDPERPEASAVAVRGGRILRVGSEDALAGTAAEGTRRVALDGVVVPGLADAHAHPMALGEQLEMLDLRGLGKAEIVARVEGEARRQPAGTWIVGGGWDQGFWKPAVFPEASDLDPVTPAHPVMLVRIDLHSAWVNSQALSRAGITRTTPDPDGGRIVRNAGGTATGMVIDEAMELVKRAIPVPSRDQRRTRLRAALDQYVRWGLTSVHDAGADLPTIALYRELGEAGELPVRVYALATGTGDAGAHYLARAPELDLAGGRLTVRGFKVMLDGALGSRGAQLAAPYHDAPSERGLVLMEDEPLRRLIRDAAAGGFQVAAHAIGDRAIRRALDAFELSDPAAATHRHRIEHLSVLDPADRPRFAKLGVIASMQPNFIGEYSRWAIDRVGPQRIGWVYNIRTILDAGAIVAAGSDYPAADAGDPMTTLYCLVTRKGARGEPRGGWQPEEAIEVDRALRLMTEAAAYASFQERRIGRIAPGYDADFTVLSADPRTTPPAELRSLQVRRILVQGR